MSLRELDFPTFLFLVAIVYGIYKLIIEPLIGGGRHRSSHNDHYRR